MRKIPKHPKHRAKMFGNSPSANKIRHNYYEKTGLRHVKHKRREFVK